MVWVVYTSPASVHVAALVHVVGMHASVYVMDVHAPPVSHVSTPVVGM